MLIFDISTPNQEMLVYSSPQHVVRYKTIQYPSTPTPLHPPPPPVLPDFTATLPLIFKNNKQD